LKRDFLHDFAHVGGDLSAQAAAFDCE
jgi:hypothetical protein